MSHSHSHSHHHAADTKIGYAFFLNLAFTILEIFGAILTNSVAILSDALHDFGDCFALGFAWAMARVSKRDHNDVFTYGFKRFSLLAAIINGAILTGGSAFLLTRAVPRLFHPEAVHAKYMIPFALVGIAANGAAALKVRSGKTLNEKVVTLHFLEDVLGWLAVLVVACVMLVYPLPILDPILAIGITGYILWSGLGRTWESIKIFLQSSPEHIRRDQVQKTVESVPGILRCKHIHIWSLDGESHILTAHIYVQPTATQSEITGIKHAVRRALHDTHHITHCTLEVEFK